MYIHCTCTLTTFNSVFMFSNTLIHVHLYRVHVHTCTVIKLIQYNIIHRYTLTCVYCCIDEYIHAHVHVYLQNVT